MMNMIITGILAAAAVCSYGATGALPEGFQEIEYVESTGGQYVDTGYCVKADDVVTAVISARREQPEVESGAFGAQPVEAPWNNACALDVRMGGTGSYRLWRGEGSRFMGRQAGFYGRKIEVSIGPEFRWRPFGAANWTESVACAPRGDCVSTLYVFAIHAAACGHVNPVRFGALKLYSLTIRSADGKVRRNLLPCRRVADGEIGLYDTVEGLFYVNLGPEPLLASGAARPGTLAGGAKSPNGRNEIRLWANPLAYEVRRDGATLVAKTEIGLKLDGRRLGSVEAVRSTRTLKRSGVVATPVYKKCAIDLAANETEVDFGDWSVRLVARDDGVAYRFETRFAGEIRVDGEQAGVTIPDGQASCVYTPETHYGWEEAVPQCGAAKDLPRASGDSQDLHFYLPFVYSTGGHTVAAVDSDTRDYPMWNLRRRADDDTGGVSLSADFAQWPAFVEYRRVDVAVRKRAPYLVRTDGARTFPWRGFMLADSPAKLCETDLIDALARPPEGDFSWVRPGKVIWDWWCHYDNLGVAKGCTTAAYRRYIDFAARHGIEHVYLDGVCDAGKTVFWDKSPKFDIPALAEYGRRKGVGIFVWLPVSWFKGNEADLVEWAAGVGLKGFKIDFLDRGDAEIERFMWRFAELCAKRKLMVSYHGSHRPAGICRTYPNVINFEGVHGLEWQRDNFRNDHDIMACDVGLFFTRLASGTMDYTPGAMDNFPVGKYKCRKGNPGAVGTRCRQMALVMMFQGYVQMLADAITKYERNMECFTFMAGIPVVWDEITSLGGTPTTYAALARRKGDVWYAAAIGNAQKQDISFETAFLGTGEWTAEIFSDAADAADEPTHYVHGQRTVKAGEKMSFTLAPGGGCIVRFVRR